ncbi:MAG: pimeloyl-ACP methyl ester esterase BioH [Steroidobacteraceae bacterium]
MNLHVETRGRGPDLVLLHGWALHGGMWGPWIDELARHARLHLVDLPGHGRSGWSEDCAGLGGLAAAVRPAVPPGAVVLGWSLGGLVALELARGPRSPVSALVLVATTPRFVADADWVHGMAPDVLAEFARSLAADHAETVRNFLALQVRGDERSHETLRQLRRSLDAHGPPDPRALGAGLDILASADLRDDLPRIAVPALVIAGDHDRLTPPGAGRELAIRLPQARHHAIARSGHAPFLSHGPEVLAEVSGFLRRHAATEAAS